MTFIYEPGQGFVDVSDKDIAKQEQIVEETRKKFIEAAKPKGPVVMLDPTGKAFTVNPDSFENAILHGWKEAPNVDYKAIEQERKAQELADKTGGTDVFGQQFANEAAFGVPKALIGLSQTPEEREVSNLAEEKLSEKYPLQHYGGKVGGFVAPLLVPGVGEAGEAVRVGIEGGAKVAERAAIRGLEEVGTEALLEKGMTKVVQQEAEASLARKIAASTAKYATEGAIYSAPQAAINTAYGDPEQAAETMVWGIGLSGVLGGVGRLTGEGAQTIGKAGFEKLSEVIGEKFSQPTENGLTKLEDMQRNYLGISDKRARKMGVDQIRKAIRVGEREGLFDISQKEIPKALEELQSKSGEGIGDHLDRLEGISEAKKVGPVPSVVAAQVESELTQRMPELYTEIHKPNYNFAQEVLNTIREGGNEPSFAELQDISNALTKAVKGELKGTARKEIVGLADQVIKKNMEEAAETAYRETGASQFYPDYLKHKENYWTASSILKDHNPFSGTGKIPRNFAELFGYTTGAGAHGGTTASLVGNMIGGHAGAITGIGLNYGMKKLMESSLIGKSLTYLKRAAADPATQPIIGGLMAKAGQEALTAHIDSIPKLLTIDKVMTHSAAASAPITHLFGSTTGLSKEQQYDRLVKAISQATTIDTELTSKSIGATSSPFMGTDYKLASLVATKKLQALNYLDSQIPKGPDPKPFQRNDWKPTPKQQQEFLKKVSIVNDPMVVWKHYQDGTMDKISKEVLQTVYPKIYQAMVDKLMQTAYDPREKPLTYSQRLQISSFTGQPIDDSIKNLQQIQQAIAPQQPQEQGGGKKVNLKSTAKNARTNTQRLEYNLK